ncbi:MAG TPA: hypothetical protein VJZ25_04315, partial [Gemmatimonadaceae bacterium]|nr:hypothetical protein [Gemmatimonadaceae bacterium]
ASGVGSSACGDLTDSTAPAEARRSGLSLPTRTVSAAFTYLSEGTKAKAVRWGSSHIQVEQRVSAVVGPEGGSLALPGSDLAMTIPAGALSDPTLITLTSKGGPHVAYDMQPHGLAFLKPVTVVQQLRMTAPYGTSDGSAIRSAYLADGKEEIAADDSATPAELPAGSTLYYGSDAVAETHVWYLSHFSRYILISGVWVLEEE